MVGDRDVLVVGQQRVVGPEHGTHVGGVHHGGVEVGVVGDLCGHDQRLAFDRDEDLVAILQITQCGVVLEQQGLHLRSQARPEPARGLEDIGREHLLPIRVVLFHGIRDRELSEIMPAEWAKFIILYRQLGGVSANAETSTQNDGINQVTIDLDRPGDVLIENPLDLIGTSVEVPAEDEGGDTLSVSSPFGADVTNLTPDVIDVIDLLSVVPDRRVVGRINVNEAPAEVLLALPGMTDQIVESMMSDRESQQTTSDASSIRQHPVWLLTEGFVEMAVMKQLWPHVTCGGDVYRAQIWGQAGSRAPAVRFESVLDATGKRTRAVYYRELSAPKDEIQLKAPPELVSAAAGEAGTTALE